MTVDRQVRFYRAPRARIALVLLGSAGAVLAVHALTRETGAALELTVGLCILAYCLQEVLWPLFAVRADGLLVGRKGFKGLGIVVGWPSIRRVGCQADGLVVLGLVDGSSLELKTGPLASADRDELLSEIERRSVMADDGDRRRYR